MAEEYLTLGVNHKTKAYPEGAFNAIWYKNGGSYKSKTLSLTVNEPKIAFESCQLWATDTAEREDIEFRAVSFEQLTKKLADGSNYKLSDEQKEKRNIKIESSSSRYQAGVFRNHKYFMTFLDEGLKLVGAKKVSEELQAGLKFVADYQKNEAKRLKSQAEAKHLTAVSMLKIFQDTGFEVIDSVDDEEIKSIYAKLKEKATKQ